MSTGRPDSSSYSHAIQSRWPQAVDKTGDNLTTRVAAGAFDCEGSPRVFTPLVADRSVMSVTNGLALVSIYV